MTEQDIIREGVKRFQMGLDGDRANRDRDEEDRAMFKGDQWNLEDKRSRNNRPTITVNRFPQFVKQITGEMRQNKPAIRILPVDDQSDPQLAEVYNAIIRHIENQSDAHRTYAKSGEQSVVGGIGWFRIMTDYADDKSFNQEIFIRKIRNPLSVVFDPDAQELTKHDANWMFVSELMTEEAFRSAYPDASLAGFPTDDKSYEQWSSNNKIRVAEYWVREPYERTLFLLSDGSTRYSDEDVDVFQMIGLAIVAERKVTAYKVKCYKMTGVEILEESDWVGQTIPLVPVVGEEVEVGDEVFRHGLIHHSRDAQRSYNFARSAMIEHIASQPKAPYLATSKMIAPFKKAWESLNRENPPVLLYEPDPQVPGGKPQREQPPTFPAAWYQEALTADGDMKATTGIYDASLGMQSNETSGVAIRARDAQGETSSYVYVDNLSAAIRQAGKVLLEIIPHIYTAERVIRIMGEDGAIEGFARINTMLPDGTLLNDISVGQFDLEVTTGPAFATKRQEAAEKMMQLVQSVPEIGKIGADMIVKALDFPEGEKLAQRLAFALLPPGIDPDVDAQRAQLQAALQQAQGPQQPDPMVVAEMENKQADTALKAAKAEETQVSAAVKAQGAQLEVFKTGVEIGGA